MLRPFDRLTAQHERGEFRFRTYQCSLMLLVFLFVICPAWAQPIGTSPAWVPPAQPSTVISSDPSASPASAPASGPSSPPDSLVNSDPQNALPGSIKVEADSGALAEVLAGDLARTLGKLDENLESVSFALDLGLGDAFLGSGTLVFRKGAFAGLDLYSRQSACYYRHAAGSSTCQLRTGEATIAFSASDSAQIPVPTLRIEKDAQSGFRLDLRMDLGSATASRTIDLWVHPETASYTARRLLEKFPVAKTRGEVREFFPVGKTAPSVIFTYEAGVIRQSTVFFPQESGPPIRFSIRDLVVNGPVSPLPPLSASGSVRTIGGSFDAVSSFVTGFYRLLSEFIPQP